MPDTAIVRVGAPPTTAERFANPSATVKFFQDETAKYQQNPGAYQLPPGSKIENGRVVPDENLKGDLFRQGLLAAAGIAAIYGGSAAYGALTGGGTSGATAAGSLAGSTAGGVGGAAGTTGLTTEGLLIPTASATGAGGVGVGGLSTTLGTAAAAGGGAGAAGALTTAQKYQGAAKALGALAQSDANNRGAQISAGTLADQIATQRQAEDRAERDDAWKRLLNADYVQHYQGYTPPTVNTINGPRQLQSFGLARTTPYDATMQQGAQGLQAEVMKRLQNGPQERPLTNVDKLSQPSTWEKLANYGAMGLSAYGAFA